MPRAPSRLPPMSAVRAFEAAARHQSFTRAAEELGMTQAAVSYQIKVLEDRIGAPLFVRLPRQVALTRGGQRLAPAVSEAFEMLRVAFAGTGRVVDNVISISVIPTHRGAMARAAARALPARASGLSRCGSTPPTTWSISHKEILTSRSATASATWPGLEAHRAAPEPLHRRCAARASSRASTSRARPTS